MFDNTARIFRYLKTLPWTHFAMPSGLLLKVKIARFPSFSSSDEIFFIAECDHFDVFL